MSSFKQTNGELFISPAEDGETYKPISSVWEGSDADLLEAMLVGTRR